MVTIFNHPFLTPGDAMRGGRVGSLVTEALDPGTNATLPKKGPNKA